MSATTRRGTWFDGRTAKAHPCRIGFERDELIVSDASGSLLARARVSTLDLSAPGRAPTRRISLPDGAVVEVANEAGLGAWLEEHGLAARLTEKMESSWRWVLGSVLTAVIVCVAAWRFGIPAASDLIAARIPPAWEARLGAASLSMLESAPFRPSQLDQSRRDQIRDRFRMMAAAMEDPPAWDLRFHGFSVGPNAFALPGGVIVMTDELVAAAAKKGGDDAILGVLAHELGHVAERHVLRGIVETALASGLIGVVIGDFSTVLATIPATLLQLSYSRAHEASADDFAIALLARNGMTAGPLADLLESLREGKASKDDASILSSHPASGERLRRLREAS